MRFKLGQIQRSFLLAVMAALAACTKGNPQLETLASIDPPGLDSPQTTVMSLTQSITVSGSCDPKFDRVEANFGSGFQDVTSVSSSSSVTCTSNQRYTFTFSMSDTYISGALNFSFGVQASRTVMIRGVTKIGPSQEVGFTINYSPVTGGAEDRYITGISSGDVGSPGSTLLSDGTVFLRARVGLASHIDPSGVANGGFQIDASSNSNTLSSFLMSYDPNGSTPEP